MKRTIKNIVFKTAKITGIAVGSLLLILFLLPYILPDTITTKVKQLVNRSINGEVNFSKARLSFFNHFPALTMSLHDFSLKGSAPYQKDTLLAANEVAFGINILALIKGDIEVDQFFITKGKINVLVNEKGEANYNVYQSAPSSGSSSSGEDTTTALKIKRIVIEKTDLLYDDLSSAMLIRAKGLNYTGRGDLSKAVFDLTSHLTVDSFDLYYDKYPYVMQKKLNADLLTSINTNSLALRFPKNRLHINKLPMDFNGSFDFLSNGYDMNFQLSSADADLDDVMSALPPQYQGWLTKTSIKGKADIKADLKGKYIVSTDSMPDLSLDMQVRKGSIAYDKAPVALSNLYLDMDYRLPLLNMEKQELKVDSAFFNVGKDYFSTVLDVKGFSAPYIKAKASSTLDLATLDRALGLADYDLKGKLDIQFSANGQYATGQNPAKLRKDIIVTSIPAFTLNSSLENGYIHYTPLPKPVEKLGFNLQVNCPDNNYRHTSILLENLDAKVLNNYVKGFLKIRNAADFPVDAELDAMINLPDIAQFYPLDSMQIEGKLAMNLRSNGQYIPAKKIFPKTEAVLKLENALLRTKYYPAPIQKIQVDATIANKEGTFRDLAVDIKPISFEFEGKSFLVKADLHNLENLHYDIVSKGEIDLGRIYKVFAQQGLDVKGTIETDLSLKGNEADAMAQRFSRLNNSGTLKVNNIVVSTDIYPQPFFIDRGWFRFQQDQMKFESFNARYGSSVIALNGSLFNVFRYLAGHGALQGKFNLNSDHLLLDEWMAFNTMADSSAKVTAAASSGVVLLPADLDLQLNAAVKNVDYNTLRLTDVKGNVQIQNGQLKIEKTGFTMAGASTSMDATYKSLSPDKAFFTYHITMNDFDVKRMYKEVGLFRELAPAAGKAEGVISVDYNLEGKLNADMYPIMPSLKGEGVLSIKKVKMKGFRLFSAMGKSTGKDGLNDPDLSKINFKTKIQNNVVTLEKTKIKVAGFRLRLQGQTSLDGKLKLKCRLGLPPFGIIGIPMNITGTGQNPRIKLGKGDELPLEEQKEETEDVDN
ncbi:MAG TPA: AsmA-like C-terminal region-containing protein [Chitinophagaceae bacterium]|nr:AsmA-like C-terminal region-containing protein [Chitinophagaceae bacterium]